MAFRLYDTATRSVRDFDPLIPGEVSIYHCGLTVQSGPHLGHIRKEVVFDVLRRWLTWGGYEVTVIANVTDIDDKILIKSAEAGIPWFAHAYRFERELHDAYTALGCLPPTYEPRATGHVPEMIEMITELIKRGHAYPADDGSGDVYFDVKSWPSYGSCPGKRSRTWSRPGTPIRAANTIPATSRCGRATRNPSQRPRAGTRPGGAAGRAGTWSARPWRASIWVMSSTSTAADLIFAFPITRTSSPSRPPRAELCSLLDAQRPADRGRGEDEQIAR